MKLATRRILRTFLFSSFILLSADLHASSPKARYILTGPDTKALKTLIDQNNGHVLTPLRYHSGWIVELDKTQAFRIKAALVMRAQNGAGPNKEKAVEEALELDGEVHLIGASRPAIISNDPSLKVEQKVPWGVQSVRAPESFSMSRGQGVRVCIIDTGVQKSHPDLKDAIVGGERTVSGPSGREDDWEDDHGHGTHVAGTIAARDNQFGVVGVAPEAELFIVKALNAKGSGNFSSLAEALRSCMAHGAQVINMSLASEDDSRVIQRAVQDALDAGIVIAAAAGNEKGPVEYPARIPGVIAVSSMSKDNRLSYFSSRGPEISFIAPGEEILSTFIGDAYAIMQGTSQATPHVAGVAALMIAAGIHDVPSHLRGDDLGLRREAQGLGRIDAYKSLERETLAF